MASFDYEVVIVGSGFGGSVAAFLSRGEGLPGRRDGGRQAVARPGHHRSRHHQVASEPLNAYEVQEIDDSMEIRGGAPQARLTP